MKKWSKVLSPNANKNAMIQGDKYRFTVLTDKLVRIEYSESGIFEDRATQSVLNRDFPLPDFRVVQNDESLEIITRFFHLFYSYGVFSKSSLRIDAKNNYSAYSNRWYYGDRQETLKGTARTLDHVDGEIDLDEGIQSRNGFSVIDDSKSFILVDEETIVPRKQEQVDLYFFAYGRNYKEALKDFYKLTGTTPLLPRYTLGNWWSRFWRYDEEEYKQLMNRFKEEDVPFSLSVIDMDWHVTDIPAKYGSGWTGYTWNKELFPDPKRFMNWLHENGMHVTLNVHPADGVRAHEEMYEPMAKELGIDTDNEDPIPFDITNKKFRDAYFKYLHRPEEERGVDFWWLDWQQGTVSGIKGLDPLWLLNHYHSLDQEKQGKRALILSRYAGVGSHRYPIGFSGDSVISWESYRFQPYFTATASNIGYSWWSHDIGGHFKGYKDDELSLRWLQFGVFSPIMRLHSSSSPFNGKEPWRYQKSIGEIMKQYLRLRHELIPYLYTMNWRTHQNIHPLMMPMYYEYPMENAAYESPNQYFFGSELMVVPVTEKIKDDILLAPVDVWLPEGKWIDFFSGRIYKGGKKVRMYRGLGQLPVLAKEGAIVPLAAHKEHHNATGNPEDLTIMIFPGKSNTFELYEDDGYTLGFQEGKYSITQMKWNWEETKFEMCLLEGDHSVLPEKRNLTLKFRGFEPVQQVDVLVNGEIVNAHMGYDKQTQTFELSLDRVDVTAKVEVMLREENLMSKNDSVGNLFDMLNRVQISFELKDRLYHVCRKHENKLDLLSELRNMRLEDHLFDAILELILD